MAKNKKHKKHQDHAEKQSDEAAGQGSAEAGAADPPDADAASTPGEGPGAADAASTDSETVDETAGPTGGGKPATADAASGDPAETAGSQTPSADSAASPEGSTADSTGETSEDTRDGKTEAAGSGAADSGDSGSGSTAGNAGTEAPTSPTGASIQEQPAASATSTGASKARPGKLVVAAVVLAALALIASIVAIVVVATDDERDALRHDDRAGYDGRSYSEDGDDYAYYDQYEDCLEEGGDPDECYHYEDYRGGLDALADLIDEFAHYYAEDLDPEDRAFLRGQVLDGMDDLLYWFFAGPGGNLGDWGVPLHPDDFGSFRFDDPRSPQSERFFSGRRGGYPEDGFPGDDFGSWLWSDAWDDPGAAGRHFEEFSMCLHDNSGRLRGFFGGAGRGPQTSTTTTTMPASDAAADKTDDGSSASQDSSSDESPVTTLTPDALRKQTSDELAEIESAFKTCEHLLPDSARAWMDLDRGFFSDIRTPKGKTTRIPRNGA